MSTPYLTVEESIRLNLIRYYGISDVRSFINHRVPTGTLAADAILTAVTDYGEVDIAYNKIDIADIFRGHSLTKNEIYIDGPFTFEELIDQIADTYSLDITADMFDNQITTQGEHVLSFSERAKYYKGSIDIIVVDNNNVLAPVPTHEWMLNGSGANTGKADIQFAPRMRYVVAGGQQFMFLADLDLQPIGVELPMSGGWVIDFEMMLSSSAGYQSDCAIFSGQDSTSRYGEIGIYSGKLSERDARITDGASPSISTDKLYRYTLVCKDDVVTCYVNTVYACSWASDNARRPTLKYMRSKGAYSTSLIGDSVLLRAIRFYDHDISDKKLDALFKMDNTAPVNEVSIRPIHEWKFESDGKDTGVIGKNDISAPFVFVEFNGRKMAKLSQYGTMAPWTLPQGFKMDTTFAIDIAHTTFNSNNPWQAILGDVNRTGYGSDILFDGKCLMPWFKNSSFYDRYQLTYQNPDQNAYAKTNQLNRMVLVKERNGYENTMYHSYVNGVLVRSIRLLDKFSYSNYTRFGVLAVSNTSIYATTMFANLQIYDQGFTAEQVMRHYNDEL